MSSVRCDKCGGKVKFKNNQTIAYCSSCGCQCTNTNSKKSNTGVIIAVNGYVKDQLFCLSPTEASIYFRTNADRQCKATPYAVAQGVYVYPGNGFSWWWLRTDTLYGRAVSTYGDIDLVYGNAQVAGTRPAMWIEAS